MSNQNYYQPPVNQLPAPARPVGETGMTTNPVSAQYPPMQLPYQPIQTGSMLPQTYSPAPVTPPSYAPQGTYPAHMPPQQQMMQPRPQQPFDPNMQLPQLIMPTDEQIAKSCRQAEDSNYDRPNMFKVPPPPGCNTWNQAHINSKRSTRVWLCPGYEAGRTLEHTVYSHFLMTTTYPKGIRFRCDDPATCLICQAHEANKNTVSKQFYESKLRFCKRLRERLYNVLSLDDEQAMQMQNGDVRPLVANWNNNQLYGSICAALKNYGPNILHPQHGRPWLISKTKTGPMQANVLMHIEVMDPQPLPQHLWYLLSPDKLWKLHATITPCDTAKQQQMLHDLGISLAGAQHQLPFSSPPQQQQMPSPQHQQMLPYQQPAPQAQWPQIPPHQHPSKIVQWPDPTQGVLPYGQPPPNQHPPSKLTAAGPDPVAQAWNNPQTTEQMMQMPSWDQPQQQFSEPPPQKYPNVPQQQTQQQQPFYAPTAAAPNPRQEFPRLQAPLPGDIMLPDGRQACFGHHDPASNMCATCPPWIKDQCVPQSPPAQATAPQTPQQQGPQASKDAELQQLQAQLLQMTAQMGQR